MFFFDNLPQFTNVVKKTQCYGEGFADLNHWEFVSKYLSFEVLKCLILNNNEHLYYFEINQTINSNVDVMNLE